jgi:hypothetical protein
MQESLAYVSAMTELWSSSELSTDLQRVTLLSKEDKIKLEITFQIACSALKENCVPPTPATRQLFSKFFQELHGLAESLSLYVSKEDELRLPFQITGDKKYNDAMQKIFATVTETKFTPGNEKVSIQQLQMARNTLEQLWKNFSASEKKVDLSRVTFFTDEQKEEIKNVSVMAEKDYALVQPLLLQTPLKRAEVEKISIPKKIKIVGKKSIPEWEAEFDRIKNRIMNDLDEGEIKKKFIAPPFGKKGIQRLVVQYNAMVRDFMEGNPPYWFDQDRPQESVQNLEKFEEEIYKKLEEIEKPKIFRVKETEKVETESGTKRIKLSEDIVEPESEEESEEQEKISGKTKEKYTIGSVEELEQEEERQQKIEAKHKEVERTTNTLKEEYVQENVAVEQRETVKSKMMDRITTLQNELLNLIDHYKLPGFVFAFSFEAAEYYRLRTALTKATRQRNLKTLSGAELVRVLDQVTEAYLSFETLLYLYKQIGSKKERERIEKQQEETKKTWKEVEEILETQESQAIPQPPLISPPTQEELIAMGKKKRELEEFTKKTEELLETEKKLEAMKLKQQEVGIKLTEARAAIQNFRNTISNYEQLIKISSTDRQRKEYRDLLEFAKAEKQTKEENIAKLTQEVPEIQTKIDELSRKFGDINEQVTERRAKIVNEIKELQAELTEFVYKHKLPETIVLTQKARVPKEWRNWQQKYHKIRTAIKKIIAEEKLENRDDTYLADLLERARTAAMECDPLLELYNKLLPTKESQETQQPFRQKLKSQYQEFEPLQEEEQKPFSGKEIEVGLKKRLKVEKKESETKKKTKTEQKIEKKLPESELIFFPVFEEE